MNVITRRSVLRAIGLGASAAGFVVEKMKSDMAINPGISAGSSRSPEVATDGPLNSTKNPD